MANFCLENRNFLEKLPENIEFFRKCASKNQIKKLPKKSEIFGILPWKIEIFYSDPGPHISNQIDAAGLN